MNRIKPPSALGAALVFGAIISAPLTASADELQALPSLEGTTYGVMLDDIQGQIGRLQGEAAGDRDQVLRETTQLLAEHNLVMIRMIDALHDKVNGLIDNQADLVTSGATKFEDLDTFVRGRR